MKNTERMVQFICLSNEDDLLVFLAPEENGVPCLQRSITSGLSGTLKEPHAVERLERFIGKPLGGELYDWLCHKTDKLPWVS